MSKVTSQDGTTIAYERAGSGPAIILVDGAFCSRAFGPMPQLASLLAEPFTVFTYDRRGRNESSDTAPYAIEREVEDLEALIRAAGGSAFLYGTSSGGVLALEAAARGLAIPRLALYEPPFMIDDSHPRPPDALAAQLAGLAASGRRSDAVELFMTKGLGLPVEAVVPMRNAPIWPALEAAAHTLAYDITIMNDNRWFPSQRAASVRAPTLVIDGGASPAWAGKAAQALQNVIPGAQRRTLEGQTHEVDSAAIAPVLEEFLLEQRQPARVRPALEP